MSDASSVASLHESETLFQRALLANDVAALAAVLHDDVHFVGPDGLTVDKATDLAAHRAETISLTAVTELDRGVQVIEGVGITRTVLRLVGSAAGQDIDLVLAYTRTWIRSLQGWVVIAAHGSAGPLS